MLNVVYCLTPHTYFCSGNTKNLHWSIIDLISKQLYSRVISRRRWKHWQRWGDRMRSFMTSWAFKQQDVCDWVKWNPMIERIPYITATYTELQPCIHREYTRVQCVTFHIKRNDVHPEQGYNVSRKLPSHTTREDNSLLSFTSLLHYWESSFPPSLMTTPGREERSHSSCWIHMCKNLKPNQSINQS